MIEEYAIVTAVRDDQASLVLERRTACGLCGQKRGCGNATWSKMVKSQPHEFTAHNAIQAQVGDVVVVGMDEHAILRSVLYLYVMPLLGLILGALLADHLFANQFYVMLGAGVSRENVVALTRRFGEVVVEAIATEDTDRLIK